MNTTNTRTIVLQTERLSIGYPAHRVAEGISVALRAGELVCLVGPNGAGKSTLMRTIAGMQPPLKGRVLLMGDDVHRLPARDLAKRLSIVLTERAHVGLLSAYALVALGRYPYTGWSGRLAAHDEAVVRWAIESVDAAALAHRSVDELSDGERQKIMIARALAQEPLVMLLDEPTAFLDLPRRAEIMRLLRQLARATDRAILLSIHDLDLALRSADRIWLMPHGGALQTGAPEDLVLSGAFEDAFRSEGVAFDKLTGSFRIDERPRGKVALAGEGVYALWTRRALEREGFTVIEGATNGCAQVRVIPGPGDARWRLVHDGQTQEHRSVYDLIASLRRDDSPAQ
ncbi:MAG: ABC transporter ATP-binding protein [Anaerolineae bacterium]|nr:ABC transporter ATP-binding protein [Anaerolineae bacterium]